MPENRATNMSTDQASLLLRKQLKELTKHPVDGFSAGLANDDLFEWSVTVLGPPETLYEGGFFQATYVRIPGCLGLCCVLLVVLVYAALLVRPIARRQVSPILV